MQHLPHVQTAADMLDELKKLHASGLRYPMPKMITCIASTVQNEEDFESLKVCGPFEFVIERRVNVHAAEI
jgi:hypothetical protein